MSQEPENPFLAYLRRLDAKLDAVSAKLDQAGQRLTALEIQVGNLAATEAHHYASLASRLDMLEWRTDRIERRFDLPPPG